MERTRTERATTSRVQAGPGLACFLIRVGQSHRPLRPEPRIIDLGELAELRLGRADEEHLEPLDGGAYRWGLVDSWMSSDHAAVVRLGDNASFELVDHGSTNGSFVNGRKVSRHQLQDRDLVELGQNFFSFFCEPVHDPQEVLQRAYSGGPVTSTTSACPAVLDIFGRLEDIAPTRIPLILRGESGTGKEVMTSVIHDRSSRSGNFVALNCAAIPEGLIESELFGHRKGAFTGALSDKKGLVEEAEQGTLLLDEIGDMPLPAQAKILRLLQEQTFTRVGDTRARKADVRFVAATHRDLEDMVEKQTFRGDLYARLNGLTLRLPPLRERKEDLGILLALFLERHGGQALTVEHEVYRGLMSYEWPFNIRELEKTVVTAVALARRGGAVAGAHMPEAVQRHMDPGASSPAPEPASPAAAGLPAAHPVVPRNVGDDELRQLLEQALIANAGNISAVARELGHTRKQIHRWMKRVEIDPESFRQ